MFTGQPPSEYQVDAGRLIGAVWGIFSEKIAPDVARKIAAGMSSKGSGGGPTLQLDATLLHQHEWRKKVGDPAVAGALQQQ